MTQITLAEWCKNNDVPERTAQQWAKSKQIRAAKKRVKVTVQTSRTVHTYVLDEKTRVPGRGKGK